MPLDSQAPDTFPRLADERFSAWYSHPRRKPLILRGARQTGKTTAVRRLGTTATKFLELNLERHEDLALVRSCRSVDELLRRLQQEYDLRGIPAGSLVFLDEIQEHPEALHWLRFFHEDHPEIAVIAAGSLLEVRLRPEALPFPVGRVEFQRLEPLTYLEFLRATGDRRLAEDLTQSFLEPQEVDEGLHHLAMKRFRQFLLVGGLPEAADVWRTTRNLVEVKRVHVALRQAISDDLLKYGTRGVTRHLEAVLTGAPAHYGARFKRRNLAPGERDKAVADALELLERAMVLFQATPTASRALPLIPRRGAARKLIPLDIGLALSQMGIHPEHLSDRPVESILNGQVAEAFVGIQLLAGHPAEPRQLSFWTREGGAKSNAEVDFLVPAPNGVLPIEVKSGAAGRLKSLHRFLADSDSKLGIRLWSNTGGSEDLTVGLGSGQTLKYRLRSLPLYLAELLV